MGDDWTAVQGVQADTMASNGEEFVESAQGRQVREWRLSQFKALGFTLNHTLLLASSKVDLSETRKLIGLGCPAAIAAEILL